MRRVVVLSTGGTIASRYSPEQGAKISEASGAELVEAIGALPEGLTVESDEFSKIGSYQLTLEDSFRMAKRVEAILAREDVAGVVVTHGTDTMEESAYLCDLVVNSDKPVVFTGAQRSADEAASDGPRNLADSIRVAADPAAAGFGTVIVFEQEIHAARDVTKTHAVRTGTFGSAEHGKLGEVDGEIIVLHRQPRRRGVVATDRIETAVELVKPAMGSSGKIVSFLAHDGVRALVLEAFGRGNTPPEVTMAASAAIRRGVTVAVATRCPQGRVAPVYGAGGGVDLAAAGAVFAGDLSAVKTRVLLALLLGAGADGSSIRSAVELHGG